MDTHTDTWHLLKHGVVAGVVVLVVASGFSHYQISRAFFELNPRDQRDRRALFRAQLAPSRPNATAACGAQALEQDLGANQPYLLKCASPFSINEYRATQTQRSITRDIPQPSANQLSAHFVS